jgi:chemotaxis protein methyltransferase CheR
METLESRLSLLLEKSPCGSFSEYHEVLRDQPGSAEWLDLIAALSKPVSSFLRHTTRARVLAETILPGFFANEKTKTLKIWSAGCATGEEPLSIAMALADAGWFDRADIEIYASDASITAIEKAQAGVFSETRINHLSQERRDRYFVLLNEGWRARPELHGRVRWSVANLMNESEIAELAGSHIIFCNNVFIYFSDRTISQTLGLFGKYMPTGGYLFTDGGDHFDALISGVGIFEEQKLDGIWVRRKPLKAHEPGI